MSRVVRGIPLLVLLIWIGFAFVPWLVNSSLELLRSIEAAGLTIGGIVPAILVRCRRPSDCVSKEMRGIVGLALGYGAYIAEIVRAGIQSVAEGQTEAALSLGMSRWQSLRFVVLPQAMRLAFPPLGNDFIAMLKDSSLVSVLTVPEIVYEARVQAAKTFQALEVWNLVALIYLILTISLSFGLRYLEQRQGRDGGKSG